jgi:cytochrome c-type biogenesis protein CcmH/NrfF
MVGPVYGALLAEAVFRLQQRSSTRWMIAAIVLSVANYELAVLITPRDQAIWICPLVCVGVTLYLVTRLIQELRTCRQKFRSADDQESRLSELIERSKAA